MKRMIMAFVIMGFASCAHAARDSSSIQIKGSDTMVNLSQAWAEEFMQRNPESMVSVTGGGSGTGLSSLISGTCDIALSSRNIKQKEIELAKKRGVDPYEITNALDGMAVVVSPSNPVSKLTMGQLADIFTGRVTNWSQVGGGDLPIVILSREVNSGTHVYFKEHVLRQGKSDSTEEFAPGALMLSSSQAIADEVAGNPSAIGYYGMGYVSPRQKAVEVAGDANSPYVAPTIENVVNGTYPVSRPLFLYANGKPEGLVKQFVDFTLSEPGQKIVMQTDFVPVKQ